jgi:hypothetical protein
MEESTTFSSDLKKYLPI